MSDAGEMFESLVRSDGDLGGVFEHDGETSYFYLYKIGEDGNKVLDAIHVFSGNPDFSGADLEIRWTADEAKVGLFIRGELWALFDTHSGTKHGGNYRRDASPQISAFAEDGFARE